MLMPPYFFPSEQKPVDVIDGAEIYAPDGARPLNVTNTDNRILASAVRLSVESVLGQLVTRINVFLFGWSEYVGEYIGC